MYGREYGPVVNVGAGECPHHLYLCKLACVSPGRVVGLLGARPCGATARIQSLDQCRPPFSAAARSWAARHVVNVTTSRHHLAAPLSSSSLSADVLRLAERHSMSDDKTPSLTVFLFSAVALSLLCVLMIGLLLAMGRCQRRRDRADLMREWDASSPWRTMHCARRCGADAPGDEVQLAT